MKNLSLSQRGFSVIELVIILLIIAIIIVIAVPQFSGAKNQFQQQNIARELKTFLERARFDSVKRHASAADEMARVVILSPTSFVLMSDLNLNGKIDANDSRQISFADPGNPKISVSSAVFPVTISFDARGQATALDGINAEFTPAFVVRNQNTSQGTEQASTVMVSASGTTTILDGSYAAVFIDNPTTTTVQTDDKINQLINISAVLNLN